MTDTIKPRSQWVIPLCWAAVLLDGFDLVVLGTVLPVLLKDGGVWGLTAGQASLLSTTALIGMMIGALTIGTITDIIGRRKVLIYTVVGFSLFTLMCALAPSLFLFGLFRFLAGLGLGGCLPTAITLATEFNRPNKASAATTIMTGYHVGAVLTALLGIVIIAPLGWRPMFVIGAVPGFILAALMTRYLPESQAFLTVTRTRAMSTANRGSRSPVASLFSRQLLVATLGFWVVSFLGLMLVYGLNTWLPQIMREAGYELGAALSMLLTLNIGAIIGLIVAGAVANRIGMRSAIVLWFGAAACFLALLSVRLPAVALYTTVLLAGFFTFSAQVLLYAFVTQKYSVASRATGLGWTAGVGRIGAICGPLVGGALLTAGHAYPWGFYVFASVAALAATAICVVRPSSPPKPLSDPEPLNAPIEDPLHP
uniref:MFS transporter n=1 Tax=Streptomyces chartreusis TaxID=1969 RepID=UPI003F4907CE